MVQLAKLLAIFTAALVSAASAHPGAHRQLSEAEHAERHLFMANSATALGQCANHPATRELRDQAIAARLAKIEEIHQERRRLQTTTEATTIETLTAEINPSAYLEGNGTCVLEPEVTEGPYYMSGLYLRNRVHENQLGVPLYTAFQFVDVKTCLPVQNLFVDYWHCNTTGVYSGVVARGNGNINDLTNINNTAMRGLAPTNKWGMVFFDATFPGHYTGRATHIHISGSYNGTVLANHTYAGSVASHVGQVFFDQDLITEVEKTAVYNSNTQPFTLNAKDSIFKESQGNGFNPIMDTIQLGDTVEDGLFAWITVGIDLSNAKHIRAATVLTANGGVPNQSGGGGGGGCGPPPDGSGNFSPPDGNSNASPPSGSGCGFPKVEA